MVGFLPRRRQSAFHDIVNISVLVTQEPKHHQPCHWSCCIGRTRPQYKEAWMAYPLQCRHNGRDGVSIHQPHDSLLNCLFSWRSKKTSKLRVTGLCAGNSRATGDFPAQRASNAENVSNWWRHHAEGIYTVQLTGPGRCGNHLKSMTSKLILQNSCLGTRSEIRKVINYIKRLLKMSNGRRQNIQQTDISLSCG